MKNLQCSLHSLFSLLFILIAVHFAYAQKGIQPPIFKAKTVTDTPKRLLEEQFIQYEIFDLPTRELSRLVADKSMTQFELKMGSAHSWKMTLFESNLHGENYVTRIMTENGVITQKRQSNTVFKGYLDDNYDHEIRLTIAEGFVFGFVNDGEHQYYIEPLKQHDRQANPDHFVLYKTSDVIPMENATCGVYDVQNEIQNIDHQKSADLACLEVELAQAADYGMYERYGSVEAINLYIDGIMNIVATKYDDEFTETLVILVSERYIVECDGCDPWTSDTDYDLIFPDFQSWGTSLTGFQNPFDLSSLWTTRNIRNDDNGSGPVGVAYVATVCDNFGMSIIEDFSNVFAEMVLLVTHELGHNFGCSHNFEFTDTNCNDNLQRNSLIMDPSVSDATEWSTGTEVCTLPGGSVAAVNNHVATRTCLAACAGEICETTTIDTVSIVNISDSSVELTWTDIVDIYEMRYRPYPSGVWTSINTISTNTWTITGLLCGTEYEIQIRPSCGNSRYGPRTGIIAQTDGISIDSINTVNCGNGFYDLEIVLSTGGTSVGDTFDLTVNGNAITQTYTGTNPQTIVIAGLPADGISDAIVSATDSLCTKTATYTIPRQECVCTPIQMENFDACMLPPGWTNVATGSNPFADWEFGLTNYGLNTSIGNFDGTCMAFFDDDAYDEDGGESMVLTSPPVDLRGYDDITLEFDYNFWPYDGGYFSVDVFDGFSWVNVLYETGFACGDFGACTPPHAIIPLDNHINANFQVAFTYDDGDAWQWIVALDNFNICGYPNECFAANPNFTVCGDDALNYDLTQQNTAVNVSGATIAWYDGQPSTGIFTPLAPATSVDLNSIDDLWVIVSGDGCVNETQVTYDIIDLGIDIATSADTVCIGAIVELCLNLNNDIPESIPDMFIWTDDVGNALDSTNCINITAIDTRTYTLVYNVAQCTDTAQTTIIATESDLAPITYETLICESEGIIDHDLTQYNAIIGTTSDMVNWYEGQPSIGGTNITATADSINLSNMPDIWATVTDRLLNCPQEVDFAYEFDYAPQLSCPSDIIIDSDPDACGAFVNVPLVGIMDDNVTPFANQSITQNYDDNNEILVFDFTGYGLIDVSQPATLTITATGDIRYGGEYFSILDENNNVLAQVGNAGTDCGTTSATVTISTIDLATFLIDGIMTFRASPSSYVNIYCPVSQVEMTLDYTPVSDSYTFVQNSYNNNGADASGFYFSGTTEVFYTVVDGCNSTDTCSMQITVNPGTTTNEYGINATSEVVCPGGTAQLCLNIPDTIPGTIYALDIDADDDSPDIHYFDIDESGELFGDNDFTGAEIGSRTLGFDLNPADKKIYLLAFAPDNSLARNLYTIDLTSGVLTDLGLVVASTGNDRPQDITFDAVGNLYTIFLNGELHTIDYTDPTLMTSYIATIPLVGGASGLGLTYNFDNNTLIYANSIDASYLGFNQITPSGIVTPLNIYYSGCKGQGIEYVGQNRLYITGTGCNYIELIDMTSGSNIETTYLNSGVSDYGDLLYIPAPPEGDVLWTDDAGNTLDTTRCVIINPNSTTTYTATYTQPSGCIDVSQITIEALDSIPSTTFNIGVCEYEDVTGLDLTQYNFYITSDINKTVEWYIGEPSNGGTNITATADSTDISNTPDLWVLVSGGVGQCTQEINITYETDYPPVITCPASITVNNDPNICGAFINIPLATATDDGITVLSGEKTIFEEYIIYNEVLEFDFNGDNIDLSQPVTLTVTAYGNLYFDDYTIRDENGDFLFRVGYTYNSGCTSATESVGLSVTDLAAFFSDNVFTLTAAPSGISTNCDPQGVEITLSYTPLNPEYLRITNDYNYAGADASDFYPNGTTTVTYTAIDGCGNTDICTIDIIVNQDTLQDEDFYFVACGDLENYDLTQLNEYFEGTFTYPTIPVWYEGQPSASGIEIDTATNLIDLTNTPDIWVLVLNPTTECHVEIQVTYDMDMTPQITCPAPIVVNADAGLCGAQVTVPLATATDDNFSPVRSQQILFQEYLVEGSTLTFDFDGSNIDVSEPLDLNIAVSGNIYFFRNFDIYDEANNFLGRAGFGNYNQCDTSDDNFTISEADLVTFLADGTLTIYAIPYDLPVTVCEDNSVQMTITYKGIIPDYINITNDYTYNGADASGFYPSGTTVVTYMAIDSCGNAGICTTTVTVNQIPTTGTSFNATLCGPSDAIDLAQIYDALLVNSSDTVFWFLGQPSAGGTDITDSSNAIDFTNMPSLWAQIDDGISGCLEEREIIYELDTPPALNCPTNITVDADDGVCGAHVTVPLATVTDDNILAFADSITIRQDFINFNQNLYFDFIYNGNINNIDTSQAITLTVIGYGDTGNLYDDYYIYGESGYIGQVGDNFTDDCELEIETFIISSTDFETFIADGVISFFADPSGVYSIVCDEDYVEMTLSFSTFTTEYTNITNDYNDGGADASDYYLPGTTTVSFFAIDGCGNTDTCTVDITVDLDVPVLDNFNFTACGDLENYDLTQYQNEIMLIASMDDPSMLHWYEGQPTMNGNDITATADSIDLTTLPDLWAFITDDTTNCPQEINLIYQFDYPPEITCPTDITVDAEAGECGAMVTIPLATTTDDNVQPIASQTIFDRLINSSGQALHFDFDATNIDTLQPVIITATGFGNIDDTYEYYRLINEGGMEFGQITDTSPTCGVTPPYTFFISSDNWAAWLADDTLSFRALEWNIDVFCPLNGVEMTLSYTPLVFEYVDITNNYNQDGADASGYYPSGTTMVTYIATDGCGNTDTCSVNVTVNPGMTTDAMQIISYADTVCTGGEVELCLTSNEVSGVLYALNAANSEGADIARYRIDPIDGELTLDVTFAGADLNLDNVVGFDINPVDGLIYLMNIVDNDYAKLYTIDLSAGVITDLGEVISNVFNLPRGLVFDNDGNLYYIQSSNLRLLDYTASPPTNSSVATTSADYRSGLTYNFDNNTFLYSSGYGNYIYLYEYDINANTNTLLAGPFSVPGGGNQCSAKAIEYVGDGLVYVGDGAGCDKMYAININTGNVSPLLEPTGSFSQFADLLYFSPFDLGTVVWTDDMDNEVGTGECISVMPDATSTYTATYTGNTACIDISEITIQVLTELASTSLDIGICDETSLTNFDWTQYDTQLTNDDNESVDWYIGQPSMGGTNITTTADSTDLTNTPDIWALTTNTLTACTQEVDVSYQIDTPPVLECPAAIIVNNDPDTCGAYVNVPIPMLTDDGLNIAESEKTITQEIPNTYTNLYFDFDTTNIDLSQGAVLTVSVFGNTQYFYEYFNIYNDDNNDFLGEVGNNFEENCVLETTSFNITAASLTTYAANGVIRFRAFSSDVNPGFCTENYISISLSYTALADEYIGIENDYTNSGADASAYYPPGTTRVTYIATDGCGKTDTCSLDITVNQAILQGEDFDFVACGDLENYDLTQYDYGFTGYTPATGKIAEWYDGQPSANGTNINANADSTNLTAMPDLWLLVTDTLINCAEEINVNYYFDFAPTITCPASITVSNEPDTCGAFVTIPLATATDDNATPLPGEQSIFIEYLNADDTLQFDFDATNIDTTQSISLFVIAYGDLYFYSSSNYSIYNENNDLMTTLTSFSTCTSDSENFTLPDSLDTFTEDGLLSFTAVPTNVGIGCFTDAVSMRLNYTPIVPDYVNITNSHNNGGADASGFYQAGTTTVAYIAMDACGNTDTCTVDIIVNQDTIQGQDFFFYACGDLSAYDLNDLNDDLSDYGQVIVWYEGQPTADGTDLSATADSIDLTSMPDIWALVADTLINCSIEIDLTYTYDYPPAISCPTNIIIDAEADTCGAYVTLPLATATDDNITAFPAQQSIRINHTEYGQAMNFVFDVSNIDTNQPATLYLQAVGELNNTYEYYDIFNENDSLITQFGNEFGFSNCTTESGALTISVIDLAAFAANDTITFTAVPTFDVYPYHCNTNYMEMTFSYFPVTPEYVIISNDQNDGGADASGFYPSGTTTVTYTASDACGNAVTCTTDVTVNQPVMTGANFTEGFCGDPTAVNLTQLNDALLGTPTDNIIWFDGQPSNGGTNINDMATAYDLSAMPDLWVQIADGMSGCLTERDIIYEIDTPPVLTCLADMTVDSDTEMCGAMVSVPTVTFTDDNVVPLAISSTIRKDYVSYNQNVQFDFVLNNINTSENATLMVNGLGDMGSSFEYFDIYNENGNAIGRLGNESSSDCETETISITIPAADLAAFLADGAISFVADPSGVDTYFCTENYVEMTLSYMISGNEYVNITNDYNDGGADASDFYPSGTTTVTFIATDGCQNADTCSIDITVNEGMTTNAFDIGASSTTICTDGTAELCLEIPAQTGDLYALTRSASASEIRRFEADTETYLLTPDEGFEGADTDELMYAFDYNPADETLYLLASANNYQLDRHLHTFDLTTGIISVLGQVTSSTNDPRPQSITFDHADNLYAVFYGGIINQIDYSTNPPVATPLVSGLPFGGDVGLTYNFDNHSLLYTTYDNPNIQLYEISLDSLTSNLLMTFSTPSGGAVCGAQGLEYIGNGIIYGSGKCNEIFTIDINNQSIAPALLESSPVDFKDLYYAPAPPSGTVVWTDDAGNTLADTTLCINVMPTSTTTYTANYTRADGCTDLSEITIEVRDTALSPTTFERAFCASQDLSGFDLTQYNIDLISNINEVVNWYIGQPSNGTDITATADSIDLSSSPDIWALVSDTLSNCTQEFDVMYQIDMPPVITCPAAVEVNSTSCGSFVNIPLATATDDNLNLLSNEIQRLTKDYNNYDQNIIFNFNGTNIDAGQPFELTVSITARMSSQYDYFNIYDENGNLIGRVGDQSYSQTCPQVEETFIMSTTDLATFLSDGVLSITADPYDVSTSFCTSTVQMTIDYAAIVPTEYVAITNDQNNNGADASGYYPSGTTEVTFFATDYCGNTDTCTTTVTVNQTFIISYPLNTTLCGDSTAMDLTQLNDLIKTNTLDEIEWFVGQPSVNGVSIDTNMAEAYDLTGMPDIWAEWLQFGNPNPGCISEIQIIYDIDSPPVIACPEAVIVDAAEGECSAYVSLSPATATDDNVLPFEPVQTIYRTYEMGDSLLSFSFDGSNIDPAQNATLRIYGIANFEAFNRYFEIFGENTDNIGTLGYYSTIECGEVSNQFNITSGNLTNYLVDDNIITFTAVPAGSMQADCPVNEVWMELSYTQLTNQYVSVTNDHTNTADASGFYPSGTTVVTFTATDGCGNATTCSVDVTVNQEASEVDLFATTNLVFPGDSTLICVEDSIASGQTIVWTNSMGDAIPNGADNCIQVAPETSTTYTATYQTDEGCLYEGSTTITVIDPSSALNITNSFFASDPCTCNSDQTTNGAGDGTFTEIVTITGEPGLILRVSSNSTGLDIPVPVDFYESFPGRYRLQFNHIDRIGYELYVEISTDGGATFTTALDAFAMPLYISNVCAYPVLAFTPPLIEFCETEPPLIINVEETSDNVNFVPVSGYPSIATNSGIQYPAPIDFDPAGLGGSVYTFTGFYNYESGPGAGGTPENPAVPLNACPTFVRVNVPINQEPISDATCTQLYQESQALIDIDPMPDYLTPENLMYRLDNGDFQASNQFIVDEEGDYALTIMDMQTACSYDFQVTCLIALPIELTAFNAHCDDGTYLLTWRTATESNVDEFVVERSVDGINFTTSGRVAAAGNSSTPQYYQYKDEFAQAGRYYYRLRIVEFDDTESYSRLEVAECLKGTFGIVDVFPNPTDSELSIVFETVNTDELNFKLTDILGRTLIEENITPQIGLNTKVIDMTALPSAVYFVILNDGIAVRRVLRK